MDINTIRETEIVSKDKNIYTICGTFKDKSGTEIAIINRHTSFEPYVVAWAFNAEGNYWGQGYYCSDLEDAIAFAYERYIQPKETEELS